jgi:tyrosyl-tRNA synthetase
MSKPRKMSKERKEKLERYQQMLDISQKEVDDLLPLRTQVRDEYKAAELEYLQAKAKWESLRPNFIKVNQEFLAKEQRVSMWKTEIAFTLEPRSRPRQGGSIIDAGN